MTGLGEELPDPSDSGSAEAMIEMAAKAAWECPQTNSDPSDLSWKWLCECERYHDDDTASRKLYEARASLESLGIPLSTLAAIVSGEWIAVPKVATSDMVDAAVAALRAPRMVVGSTKHQGVNDLHVAYRSMLFSAPKSPEHSE